MSKCERFAHDKWATVSKLLRFTQVAQEKWANCYFFENIAPFRFRSQKMSDSLKKFEKIVFFVHFYSFFEVLKKAKDSLIPSERSEQIAQVAQDKRETESDSLRLLRRNEPSWANPSDFSPIMSEWANCSLFEQIAHLLTFLAKNEWFAQKFYEWIPNSACLLSPIICLLSHASCLLFLVSFIMSLA